MHENHPGVSASDCPARITVNAIPTANHGSGYACGGTGGHCLPGSKCSDRVSNYLKSMEVREYAQMV